MITTKLVRFAEDKTGYEWTYRKDAESYEYNQVWLDDTDGEEIAQGVETPRNDTSSEEPNKEDQATKEEEIVRAPNRVKSRKGGRKKIIRNAY